MIFKVNWESGKNGGKRRIRQKKSRDVMPLWAPASCQTAQGWEAERGLGCTRLAKMSKLRWLNYSRKCRDVLRNRLLKVEEMWKIRFTKVRSRYDPKRKVCHTKAMRSNNWWKLRLWGVLIRFPTSLAK